VVTVAKLEDVFGWLDEPPEEAAAAVASATTLLEADVTLAAEAEAEAVELS
jgi:hypothetical protein